MSINIDVLMSSGVDRIGPANSLTTGLDASMLAPCSRGKPTIERCTYSSGVSEIPAKRRFRFALPRNEIHGPSLVHRRSRNHFDFCTLAVAGSGALDPAPTEKA